MSVAKPEGGPAASVKSRQKSCMRSSGIIKLLAGRPSDEAASDEATMINHVRVTNIARNANRKIPVSHMYPPGIGPGSLMTGRNQVDYWTSSGTMYECSEIPGSPQLNGKASGWSQVLSDVPLKKFVMTGCQTVRHFYICTWTLTWTCSFDMDMQHGHGHAVWTWKCSMVIDTQHGFDHAA
jgi:hypothetical protein